LACYEAASGQKINREKTSIYFNRNTKKRAMDVILQETGVDSIQQFERYLGLQALIGRSRVSPLSTLLKEEFGQSSMDGRRSFSCMQERKSC
jgi:hypothetical protein